MGSHIPYFGNHLKLTLRGQIISHVAFSNKECSREISDFTNSIRRLDHLYSESPNAELYKKQVDLQAKLNIVTTKHVEQLLLKTRGNCYEYG